MVDAVKVMAEYACVPLVVKPNAGLPFLQDGVTCYDMDAESFSEAMMPLVDVGATVLGGCCGTTPQHIQKLVSRLKEKKAREIPERKSIRALTTERNITPISLDGRFRIVGERINPTGKKELQEKLRAGDLSLVMDMAEEQEKLGASILDVNMGMNGIDEKEMMLRAVNELTMTVDLPLSIDSSYVDVVESALRIYPGRALINSISLEPEKFEKLIPIAKKYGAMFILLPLSDAGLPKDLDEKKTIIHTILDEAKRHGMAEEDIVVDGLVATIGANKNAALEVLETIRYCKNELGVATICGLSNISFGLPQRELINAAFFTMAMNNGLSAGIINPNAKAMRQAYDTFCVLGGYDAQCMNYIENYAVTDAPNAAAKPATAKLNLTDSIIKGLKDQAYRATEEELKTKEPMEIINGELVPALDVVGQGFEKGTMFLPQLLMSAEAAKAGFEAIRQYVQSHGEAQEKKATIVIATVKGDIHDIGKNIVKVLLENYGYEVIDLGKDVPPEKIVETVVDKHAPLVGLSALMTTTVVNMEESIKELHKEAPWCKIMVGGAVLTQEYADMIGADFYGKDAMQSVYYAERLLNS